MIWKPMGFSYTDEWGTFISAAMEVEEQTWSRTINYGTQEKPFRLKFTKILKIGFVKR